MSKPDGARTTMIETPTRADDCERMIKILDDASVDGLSMDQIRAATLSGEVWSYRTINSVLCDLGSQVGSHKIRGKNRKAEIHYFLKRRSCNVQFC